MAERSFAKEVLKLRLGEGDEFRGEGILAVTKALLQSGVAYVGGYQGAPISHLMDVLGDAQKQGILEEWGVHFESSASEAAAAAMLAASVNYPIRGAVTWKSTVGTNVASDALANLASGGVTGGALIVIGEDYGEGSSIMQERTHSFAMKSQIWLLDPRPNLTTITNMVEHGFELSEASHSPVMLELRIRACHVSGRFNARDNRKPGMTLRQAMENPQRAVDRIVLPPASFLHEQEKVSERWPAAVAYIREHRLNEFFAGETDEIGIIVQGGLYNTLLRAMALLGCADYFGNSKIPIYVLNVTYPLVDEEVIEFCRNKQAVLMVEEGQPDFLEQALNTILRRAELSTAISGSDVLPLAGEYTGEVIMSGLLEFLRLRAPHLLQNPSVRSHFVDQGILEKLAPAVVPRPPGFCTGCPERPVFTALKMLQQEMGPFHVSGDIGCHLFSIYPPFNIGNTTMGYGLGTAGASAFDGQGDQHVISLMGDGGFWHNGLTSGIGNAVFNKSDKLTIIIDNNYAAATGGQDILSSQTDSAVRSTRHPIEKAVRGVGVEWARTVRTYDLELMRSSLNDALTTNEKGPKVIVAQSECMLNKQRRVKPQLESNIANGKRVVRERFGVDADLCTGDHSCIRLSGCPSLTVRHSDDPLKTSPVAYVDNTCVGCGHCGEVAHAAVLCPSFYQADVIINPTRWDRARAGFRRGIIDFLQRRIEKKRLKYTF
jgi:indolepyruvate ferredoxin oxidoreductase alpha subunit